MCQSAGLGYPLTSITSHLSRKKQEVCILVNYHTFVAKLHDMIIQIHNFIWSHNSQNVWHFSVMLAIKMKSSTKLCKGAPSKFILYHLTGYGTLIFLSCHHGIYFYCILMHLLITWAGLRDRKRGWTGVRRTAVSTEKQDALFPSGTSA